MKGIIFWDVKLENKHKIKEYLPKRKYPKKSSGMFDRLDMGVVRMQIPEVAF